MAANAALVADAVRCMPLPASRMPELAVPLGHERFSACGAEDGGKGGETKAEPDFTVFLTRPCLSIDKVWYFVCWAWGGEPWRRVCRYLGCLYVHTIHVCTAIEVRLTTSSILHLAVVGSMILRSEPSKRARREAGCVAADGGLFLAGYVCAVLLFETRFCFFFLWCVCVCFVLCARIVCLI